MKRAVKFIKICRIGSARTEKGERMLTENLREIEDALIRMEDASDIWQNGIIKALLRAVYALLTWAIRKERT